VVVTGFQGLAGGEITTLGRGGSDATAVALAAALGATECEIYTDVEGVYSGDPRRIPDAQKLEFVSYDEMLELAAAGAAVLQLRAVELAQSHGVTLHVRSSLNERSGTLVGAADAGPFERPLIIGVSHGEAEALFRISGADHADLFAAIGAGSINLDTIIRLDGEIVISASLAEREEVGRILDGLGVEWSERGDLSKVSVVGGGMKSHPGIAADVFATVRDLHLEARFLSTSPMTISFYVSHAAAGPLVRALHERLRLGLRRPHLELSA
jgi:aspartate kinase